MIMRKGTSNAILSKQKLPTATLENHPKEPRRTDKTPSSTAAVLSLLDLPGEILWTILNYFSYHEVAQLRAVSRRFNTLCQRKLNAGFIRAARASIHAFNFFDSKLPKRPSERSHHRYAGHDIIARRIKSRTHLKPYVRASDVRQGKICYFAGKLTDEALLLVQLIRSKKRLPDSAQWLTVELMDLGKMAGDHFKKVIQPLLRKTQPRSQVPGVPTSGAKPLSLKEEVRYLKVENKVLKDRLEALEKQVSQWTNPEKKDTVGQQKPATLKPAPAEETSTERPQQKPEPAKPQPNATALVRRIPARRTPPAKTVLKDSAAARPSTRLKPNDPLPSKAGRPKRLAASRAAQSQDSTKQVNKKPRRS